MFETKFPENIDIDNESDFKIAEILSGKFMSIVITCPRYFSEVDNLKN